MTVSVYPGTLSGDTAPVSTDVQSILNAMFVAIADTLTTTLGSCGTTTLSELNTAQAAIVAAIAAIPPVNLAPVLAAIAAIPTVGTSLSTYGVAKTTDIGAAQAAIVSAISSIPPVNLAPVLAAIAGIPTTDVAAALMAYGAAKPADIAAALTTYGAATSAQVTAAQTAIVSALTADTSPLATSSALTTAQTAINAHTDTATAAVTTAVNAHTDSAVTAAQTAIVSALTADTSPLATSSALTTAQTAINTYTDTATAAVTTAVNAHTDTAVTAAQTAINAHTDTATAAVTTAVNAHTDSAISASQTALLAAMAADTSPLNTSITTATSALATAASVATLQTTANATQSLLTDPVVGLANIEALIAAATPSGIQQNFRRDKIPAGYTPIVGMNTVPTGGFGTSHSASSANSGAGNAVFVATGIGSGIWRYRLGYWQRFSIDTNLPVGSAIATPIATSASVGNSVAAAVIGQYIYYCGLINSSNAGTTGLYRLDTASGTHTTLASMPRALGGAGVGGGSAVALSNENILFTTTAASGLTTTAAAYPFWIYNPTTNATPTEVIVSLPITKPALNAYTQPLQLLPSGKVITMDVSNPSSGNRLSCNLTVGTSTIAVSSAENTGATWSTACAGMIPNGTGVFVPGGAVVYAEGTGWSASMTSPAYGSFYFCDNWTAASGYGYVGYQNVTVTGITLNVYVYIVSGTGIGEAIVPACKN